MNSLTAGQLHALAVVPEARRAQVFSLLSIGVSFSYALKLANA